ncbi:GNAT family N-acetyltransferase, partial [Bradyrhizobium sp.]|uniref:GNAT family N-acetyltransferase n=1 Tax=Bradyrhizobium sp. TaxID=376 RepID=UPI0025C159B5
RPLRPEPPRRRYSGYFQRGDPDLHGSLRLQAPFAQQHDLVFEAKVNDRYPVIGLEDSRGALLAFGSFGPFRAWPAYKYTVEHSVYVHKGYRGQGLGREVLLQLIAATKARQVHCMIGGIDATNSGSIALHERLGFRHVGTLPQVGFKFGRWLDVSFYQLLLDTPAEPMDG